MLQPPEAQPQAKHTAAQAQVHPRAALMAVPHAPLKSCQAQSSQAPPTPMSEAERQTTAGNSPAVQIMVVS